jgi:hypothetical protein
MNTLDELALRYGTDKASNGHGYTRIYESYFAHLRDEPIVLVEFGVGGYGDPCAGGASLRMWNDWFPKGRIIGVDDQPKNLHLGPRVDIYRGDQASKGVINFIARHGPFDIVIDDASHVNSLTISTFENVWPHIKPGGFYVCEDTCESYKPKARQDPDSPLGLPTMMQFFRRLADEVNYEPHVYPAEYRCGYDLQFVHFWRWLAILRKQP